MEQTFNIGMGGGMPANRQTRRGRDTIASSAPAIVTLGLQHPTSNTANAPGECCLLLPNRWAAAAWQHSTSILDMCSSSSSSLNNNSSNNNNSNNNNNNNNNNKNNAL
jgi:hypothetical protein